MYLENFINVRSENAFVRKTLVGCYLVARNIRPIIPTDTTSVISLQVY
jgi:hypothetical protein